MEDRARFAWMTAMMRLDCVMETVVERAARVQVSRSFHPFTSLRDVVAFVPSPFPNPAQKSRSLFQCSAAFVQQPRFRNQHFFFLPRRLRPPTFLRDFLHRRTLTAIDAMVEDGVKDSDTVQ